jgi:hypothetical protein
MARKKKKSNLVEFTKRKTKTKQKKFPIFNVETKQKPPFPSPPQNRKKKSL